MTSIRFMALWLSLVLATLSYAAPPRAQGGAFRMDTADVLPRIAETPQSRLRELLPWNWMTARLARAAA